MHAIPAKTRSGGILGPIGCFGKFSFLDSCGVLLVVSGPQLEGVASAAVRAGFYFFLCGNGTFHFYWGMTRPPSGAATRHFAKNAASRGPVACDVPEAQPNERARRRHAKELAGLAVE
ncbi:uncharacterized protein Tco025E_09456 [Trypanosoma conorhini]|uniref:Uncharacterized protein n=1 Tax=Trypanosoma conorhini TaxID=83891 RepID=A0A3R7JYH7_9TRYP|nr:uncharacterized protein Tco025E_09456 [Trypanosoma conorhini]RNE97486.1 hypothetical protein Tco025E_09456 [Trypanosoma conorhini]